MNGLTTLHTHISNRFIIKKWNYNLNMERFSLCKWGKGKMADRTLIAGALRMPVV
jgi:hypothetical protein